MPENRPTSQDPDVDDDLDLDVQYPDVEDEDESDDKFLDDLDVVLSDN